MHSGSNPSTELNEELNRDPGTEVPFEKLEVKCPWFSQGCSFTGISSACEAHVREKHKCTRNCRFDTQARFVHGKSCGNRCFTKCSSCGAVDVNKSHFVKEHECIEGCLFLSGEERWHDVKCKGWFLKRCIVCEQRNVGRTHICKHFPKCVRLCGITQNKEGFVYIQHIRHQEHRAGDKTFVEMQQEHITEENTINED